MSTETATNVSPRSGKVKRFVTRAVLALVALIVLAAIVGASYQAIGNSRDAQRFPNKATRCLSGRNLAASN